MDVQVERDNSDAARTSVVPLPAPDRVEASAVRRFAVDPASSPMLLAALAWDAPPRR